jgi:hypothetical protein
MLPGGGALGLVVAGVGIAKVHVRLNPRKASYSSDTPLPPSQEGNRTGLAFYSPCANERSARG